MDSADANLVWGFEDCSSCGICEWGNFVGGSCFGGCVFLWKIVFIIFAYLKELHSTWCNLNNRGWHTSDRVCWIMLIDIVAEWRSNQSDEFKDEVVWNPQIPKQMVNTVDTLSHASKVKRMRHICIQQNIGSAWYKTQVAS
jgi:hypothetical protein